MSNPWSLLLYQKPLDFIYKWTEYHNHNINLIGIEFNMKIYVYINT